MTGRGALPVRNLVDGGSQTQLQRWPAVQMWGRPGSLGPGHRWWDTPARILIS
jgi:hypothetical protein